MWVAGAGVMVAGLLGMVLTGILPGLLIMTAGAALAAGSCWSELQAERRKNAWRKAYPSYKY